MTLFCFKCKKAFTSNLELNSHICRPKPAYPYQHEIPRERSVSDSVIDIGLGMIAGAMLDDSSSSSTDSSSSSDFSGGGGDFGGGGSSGDW